MNSNGNKFLIIKIEMDEEAIDDRIVIGKGYILPPGASKYGADYTRYVGSYEPLGPGFGPTMAKREFDATLLPEGSKQGITKLPWYFNPTPNDPGPWVLTEDDLARVNETPPWKD